MVFDVGDSARIDVTFTDLNENLVDPTTVTLTIQAPDDTQTSPSPVHDSTGLWHYDLDCAQSGEYKYRWVGTGVVQSVNEGTVIVRESILVPTPTPPPTPEWTQADLLALDKAIASGVNRVKFADREIQYNSIDDMLKARAIIVAYLSTSSATPIRRQIRVYTGDGW